VTAVGWASRAFGLFRSRGVGITGGLNFGRRYGSVAPCGRVKIFHLATTSQETIKWRHCCSVCLF
jgi:hypothetical protein